jgi:hypothetical protein
MTSFRRLTLAATAFSALAFPAHAAVITLDFEGVGDLVEVGDFYKAAYGIEFAQNAGGALAVVDSDAGGSGFFGNAPSPDTVIVIVGDNAPVLNFANGFSALSFFYSSSTTATLNVYDGLDGTGSILGSFNLLVQFDDNCSGDPNNPFCNWTNAGGDFSGIARSINFIGGTPEESALFDNLTFTTADAPGAVPEPSAWAMMIGGFGAIGSALRYRRRKVSVRFA